MVILAVLFSLYFIIINSVHANEANIPKLFILKVLNKIVSY
jgi:hypothetical protein